MSTSINLFDTTPGQPAPDIIDSCIREAVRLGASDLHIDPSMQSVRLRVRIDGVLKEAHPIAKGFQEECIARLKILSGLRTDEHFTPQDGRFRYRLSDTDWVDVRISICPTFYGENAVLRLLSSNAERSTLYDLGFSESDQRTITRILVQAQGMILATGPTGSGKTSTLYALMRMLLQQPISLVSLEDPIEYSVEKASQMQIHPAAGFTFASGLRSVLRQDPDVIMIGEIRDSETARLATNAALTGHLVLSTLHTNNAAATLTRLMDMGVEPFLVASTVRLVIAQRLARRICDECRHPKQSTDGGNSLEFEGLGCAACAHTGYSGRIGIYELLEVTPAVEESILKRASPRVLLKLARDSGSHTFTDDASRKVIEGLTTREEVIRLRYE